MACWWNCCKILGQKYYIWFIVDSETRFVLGYHLSPHRDSPQAFSLFNHVKDYGAPNAIVSDRYSAYKVPVKSIFDVKHIRVASFKDDISNNLIEAFNKQFKYWYKTRYGFNSFESANSMIMMFVFFYNFIRPHSSLSDLTPAQVAGLRYSDRQRNSLLLVSWFSPNLYSNGRTMICHRACVSTFILPLTNLSRAFTSFRAKIYDIL